MSNPTGSPYGGYPPQSPYTPPPQNPYGQPQQPAYGQQPQNPYAQPYAQPYSQPAQNPYAMPPQNPYAQPNALGHNANGDADDQNVLQRIGLSKWKAALLVLALVVAGGFWAYDHFKKPQGASVGDCLNVPAYAGDAVQVSCSDANANYVVVKKFGSTGDPHKCDDEAAKDPKVTALYQRFGKDKFVLCIKPK